MTPAMDLGLLERARQSCRKMPYAALAKAAKEGEGEMVPEAWFALNEALRLRQAGMGDGKVVLTTAPSVDGYQVRQTLDIVSAECALGMGMLSDWLAGLTDTFGGRSGTTQNALKAARETCQAELRQQASALDADAVIAVTFTYSQFSGQSKSMIFVVAVGTAVRVGADSITVT